MPHFQHLGSLGTIDSAVNKRYFVQQMCKDDFLRQKHYKYVY